MDFFYFIKQSDDLRLDIGLGESPSKLWRASLSFHRRPHPLKCLRFSLGNVLFRCLYDLCELVSEKEYVVDIGADKVEIIIPKLTIRMKDIIDDDIMWVVRLSNNRLSVK